MAFNKAKFAETARQRIENAEKFWNNWRSDARRDFGFIAGDQWDAADEAKLRRQKRPPITFNYSEKMIDAVVGAEVSNRNEVSYKPRATDDFAAAELWNAAAQWARDECCAEDEESDAFRDMLICGLGWTCTSVSYDEDQDGKITIDRVDPLEMRSDPAASKPGLTDRRFAYRKWYVDEKEAMAEWPKSKGLFTTEDEENTSKGVITRGQRYSEGMDREAERHKDQVLITCYECVEHEPIYRAALGGKIHELTPQDHADLHEHMDEAQVPYVKQTKNVYYRAFFSGESLLEVGLSPCQDGFMYQAITGKRDQNKNTWYGLTRVMRDPQCWANKWLSQILHIINSNAKGGLMAESNAFVDIKKAQEEWSNPDSITLFREGALANNRVKEKSVVNFPAGLDKLMQFALGSLPMVTGINLEALGLANREQAGVLEQQRKQAAYGLLSPLFDALRRYRKMQGRVLLHMINEYISDGRLIRIGGPDSQQTLPLVKTEGALKYDIIVDTSPNAPDVKERTWAALENLVPALLKAGMAVPPDILDYAPIPTALATKWKEFAAQQQQQVSPEQMQQLQEEVQQLTQENQQIKMDHSMEVEKIQAEIQIMWQKLELEKAKVQSQVQIQEQKGQIDTQIKAQQGQQQLEQDRQQHELDLELQQQQGDQQLTLQKQQGTQKTKLAQQQVDNKHTVDMKKRP
jgi:hypothetical protein